MHPLSLDGTPKLVVGIILGVFFGFLLVKSGLAWRKTYLDTSSFKDATLLKMFLFSIAIGTVMFYFFNKWGLVNIHIKPVYFWAVLIGGILTGIGVSICGAFPETAVTSMASGRTYAVWVFAGMLLAIPAVKLMSSPLSQTIYSWSAPFSFHERLDAYFSGGTAVLWISIISIILTLFLQFTIGGTSGGGENAGSAKSGEKQ